jgi:hypothetical protein
MTRLLLVPGILVVAVVAYLAWLNTPFVIFTRRDDPSHYTLTASVQRGRVIPGYDLMVSVRDQGNMLISRARIIRGLGTRRDAWTSDHRVTAMDLDEKSSTLTLTFADGHKRPIHVELGSFK